MEELAWATRRFVEHVAATAPGGARHRGHPLGGAVAPRARRLARPVDRRRTSPRPLCGAPVARRLQSRLEYGAARNEDRPRAARRRREPDDGREPARRAERVEAEVLDRIVDAAEGNPLFAEQLLRMLVDEGTLERRDGTWHATGPLADLHVPPTIQALLAARLDTLEPDERSVIEPASVVGYIFAEAAVSALAPPDVSSRVMTEIATLTQKHLVRPRRRRGRDAAPLPAHHDPRHRVRRHPQAGPCGSPRALRRLGRRGQPRPRRRVRGDPRLPPRAGVDVPLRARAARRSRPRDRRGRGAPPRVGGQTRVRARRRPRRRDAYSAGRRHCSPSTTASACSCFPITARRS